MFIDRQQTSELCRQIAEMATQAARARHNSDIPEHLFSTDAPKMKPHRMVPLRAVPSPVPAQAEVVQFQTRGSVSASQWFANWGVAAE